MSYSKTINPVRKRTKNTTRRNGWLNLKPGEHYTAIEKGQGLKKGEHVVPICRCICISNELEPLEDIIKRPVRDDDIIPHYPRREVEREGFPEMSEEAFVEMFCKMNSKPKHPVYPETEISRIVFSYFE